MLKILKVRSESKKVSELSPLLVCQKKSSTLIFAAKFNDFAAKKNNQYGTPKLTNSPLIFNDSAADLKVTTVGERSEKPNDGEVED